MPATLSPSIPRIRRALERAVLVLLVAGAALVLLVLFAGPVHLIMGALGTSSAGSASGNGIGAGGSGNGLDAFVSVISSVQTYADYALGSVSLLGVLGGAIMMGIGSDRGVRVLAFSAGAVLAVLAGNGIIY